MSILRDKLLLLGAGLALAALIVSGGLFALTVLELGEHWALLWPYTVFLFLVLVVSALGEIRRRSRTLTRRWPLVVAFLIFLGGHLLVIGWLLRGVGREWGMPHFLVLSIAETLVFAIVFERSYEWCTDQARR